jgi:hypothetical protein
VVFDDVVAGPHVRVGPIVVQLPPPMGKQVWRLRRRGRDRATCGRKEASAACPCSRTQARDAERRGRKEAPPLQLSAQVRSPHARAWDPAPPARPRPRGRRGRSSTYGAEESLPRLASTGREREGSWGGVAATAPASGRASAARGRSPSRGREADGVGDSHEGPLKNRRNPA